MAINALTFNTPIPPNRVINPKQDDALIYNATTGLFENQHISVFTGAKTTDQLDDVEFSNLLNGDVLVYDGVQNIWINQDLSFGSPPTRFTVLSDTNSTPTPNQYLKWNNFTTLDVDSEIIYVDTIPTSDITGLDVVLDTKVDKIIPAIMGSIATLDATGNIQDSGLSSSDFATAAQGALADTATQPGDAISTLVDDINIVTSGENISLLSNDAGYITSVQEDSVPVLGGHINVNNFEIQSAVSSDIVLRLTGLEINKGNIYLDIFQFPKDDGTAGSVLTTDGNGVLSFQPTSALGGLVSSVFGRSGTVVAVAGDYDTDLITNASLIVGATLTDALNLLNTSVIDLQTNGVSAGDNISLLVNDANYITTSSANLLQLNDTPSSYTGQATKLCAVNSMETGIEFINVIDGGSY